VAESRAHPQRPLLLLQHRLGLQPVGGGEVRGEGAQAVVTGQQVISFTSVPTFASRSSVRNNGSQNTLWDGVSAFSSLLIRAVSDLWLCCSSSNGPS
jgi:hypothetical protein